MTYDNLMNLCLDISHMEKVNCYYLEGILFHHMEKVYRDPISMMRSILTSQLLCAQRPLIWRTVLIWSLYKGVQYYVRP
jgi:hypothetical protein